MKKWLIRLFTLSLALSLFLAGCVRTEEKEVTGEKLDFTVVPPEEIPEELKSILDANKESEMMISYRIGEYLYIIRGYGKQETGGCRHCCGSGPPCGGRYPFFLHAHGTGRGRRDPEGILLPVCGDQASLAGTGSIF